MLSEWYKKIFVFELKTLILALETLDMFGTIADNQQDISSMYNVQKTYFGWIVNHSQIRFLNLTPLKKNQYFCWISAIVKRHRHEKTATLPATRKMAAGLNIAPKTSTKAWGVVF